MHFTLSATAAAPSRAHATDAGIDLCADAALTLQPGQRAVVPTGVRGILPAGTTGLVCPRSGLAANHGVTVLNAPGVIDEGFTGEIKVILINLGDETALINHGDRIAQLLIVRADTSRMYQVNHLDYERMAGRRNQNRGPKGFGSTGR